jgi:CRP-like cAMP-binding protein
VTEPTVASTRAHARRALFEGDYATALSHYLAALLTAPGHLDLRLRVGDALLAASEVQRAATVYTTVARHAAHSGYPLRALVAIKVLVALEPALSPMLGSLGELYALDSGRIGKAVRPALLDDDTRLTPEAEQVLALQGPELFERAEQIGKDVSSLSIAPGNLPPIPLLSELERDDFARLVAMVTLVRKRPGEVVIQQGDPGRSFFLVARGDLEVSRVDPKGEMQVLAELHEGAVVGEMALLSNAPRSASVIAASDADLLELDVEALSAVSSGAAAIARALDKFTRERLVNNLMQTAPLFRPLDRNQRIDLVRRFVAHDVAAGTDLIREGEPGQGLYVVLSGAVDVWKRDGADKVLLATLGPGDVFGEISLLGGVAASATVTAAQRSTVLFLSREYVERLVETLPALREYLEGLVDEREMDTRLWLESGGAASLLDDIEIELD